MIALTFFLPILLQRKMKSTLVHDFFTNFMIFFYFSSTWLSDLYLTKNCVFYWYCGQWGKIIFEWALIISYPIFFTIFFLLCLILENCIMNNAAKDLVKLLKHKNRPDRPFRNYFSRLWDLDFHSAESWFKILSFSTYFTLKWIDN